MKTTHYRLTVTTPDDASFDRDLFAVHMHACAGEFLNSPCQGTARVLVDRPAMPEPTVESHEESVTVPAVPLADGEEVLTVHSEP